MKSFFHYKPSYYHLHVHFVHYKSCDKAASYIGVSVPLEDVIDNIELDSGYYQKKTMVLDVGENHDLYKLFKGNNLI